MTTASRSLARNSSKSRYPFTEGYCRRDPFETLRPQVTSGGEVASGVLTQNPCQVWAPISHADEPYLDHEFTSS